MAREFLKVGENIMGQVVYVCLSDEAGSLQATVTGYEDVLSEADDYKGIITCHRLDQTENIVISNVKHVSTTKSFPFWYYSDLDAHYSMQNRLDL